MLSGVGSGKSSEEIRAELKTLGYDRSEQGIVGKLLKLSRQNPDNWDPEKVGASLRKFNSRMWRRPGTQKHRVERSRRRVLDYLRGHPDYSADDLRGAGLGYDLFVGYGNRTNSARRELGLEERLAGFRPAPIGRRQQNVMAYLKAHPDVTRRDLASAGLNRDLRIAYGGINAARIAAGILPEGYISGAEASRTLGLSKERVSQLYDNHRFDGHRLGKRLFVSAADVEAMKKKRVPVSAY